MREGGNRNDFFPCSFCCTAFLPELTGRDVYIISFVTVFLSGQVPLLLRIRGSNPVHVGGVKEAIVAYLEMWKGLIKGGGKETLTTFLYQFNICNNTLCNFMC